jgi:alkanesulfonate monooxygenase SsuD/methylene tetrahydromethanopterin reductase-like flavin-dependent oxidoreductase (luciferase family)
MDYGMTLPRDSLADQPSPLAYMTNLVRESDRLGYTYCVIGDRLESGMDPFSVLSAVAQVSGRTRLATSVLVLPPRGVLVTSKLYASLDVFSGGRVIAGVGTGSLFRDYDVVGIDHVARLADGWLSSAGPGHQSPEQFVEDVKRLNAFLLQKGKDPATFPSAVSTMALFISEDEAELARIGGPVAPYFQMFFIISSY